MANNLDKFMTKKGREVQIIEPNMSWLDEVLRFVNELAKEDTYLSLHPGKQIERVDEEKWLQGVIKNVENGATLFYWAVYDGKIVGSVDINRGKSVRDWHVGTIGLMVSCDFRGEGLGRFLLQYILEKAKAAGLRTTQLEVFSDNEIALNLYKKLGFKEIGRLPDGFYRKKKFSDKIIMSQRIN